MAYLRMVLMMKALSVNIERVWFCLLTSSVIVMAASSDRFIVCLSGCNFISICMVVRVLRLIMDAPRMWLPVARDPSVYMKSVGFHATLLFGRIREGLFVYIFKGMEGYGSL